MAQLAVLMKVVPDASAIPWDPERRSARRDEGALRLNSLDQRALRLALSLRRPGDTVTVLSMGPPSAAEVLRTVRAVGADRCCLLSDPSLAGSDLLVTARVLAHALRRLAPDLVLTGSESTDGGNGAVDAMIAEALDLPRVGPVRGARWDLDGAQLVISTDLPSGTAEYELTGSGVLAVGEKLGKPLRPEPGALDQFPLASVEIWGLPELSLPSDGYSGGDSPTTVVSVIGVPGDRHPKLFADGTPQERVELALDELRQRLASAPPRLTRLPSGPAARAVAGSVVLVTGEDGRLDPSSLPILGAFPDSRALWVGAPPTVLELETLGRAGALYLTEIPGVSPNDPPSVARSIEEMLASAPHPPVAAFVGEAYGREVAARLAYRRGIGMVADIVSWRLGTEGEILWEKPAFGSAANASISCATQPAVITIRPGTWMPTEHPVGSVPDAVPFPSHPRMPGTGELRQVSTSIDPRGETGELQTARWMLLIGMGVGDPHALQSLASWVRSLGGAIGGTRKVVDAGWLSPGAQVGLTGRHLAPELALLAGVSGSPYHLVGLRRARVLVAVNSDPAAEVFRGVDVGIVARWEDVAPFLRTGLSAIAESLTS
ncbi:MAG: FAD-binding protein [Thermoplasmata archaeon]|nr:FAD-binding protein [Thermoplasmata archaeon]